MNAQPPLNDVTMRPPSPEYWESTAAARARNKQMLGELAGEARRILAGVLASDSRVVESDAADLRLYVETAYELALLMRQAQRELHDALLLGPVTNWAQQMVTKHEKRFPHTDLFFKS